MHTPTRRVFLGASAAALSVAITTRHALAAAPGTSSEAGSVKMPAVIGYPNEKGVTIECVTYPARNLGTSIVANLFKPAGFSVSQHYAAIVVTHPFGGVKEQTAGLYAQRLAEEGFVTLAYDASYQGESGGEPRLMEVQSQRLDDISCAIDYLVRHPQVNPERIGSLGIRAGGSYALCQAQTELRVKAVAAVSTFNLGEARREGMGTISYEERMKRLRDAAAARSREARGVPVQLVPVVPDTTASFTERTPQLYREGYDYYRTPRAQHPNSPNRYVFSSLPQQMALTWLLVQKPWIVPIPGTTQMAHMVENAGAMGVQLTPAEISELNAAVSAIEVQGARLPDGVLRMSGVEAPPKN